MPTIEVTSEQEERLGAVQEKLARELVGKYGHVRPRDAMEYLLDRYEHDAPADAFADGAAELDGDGTDSADEADGSVDKTVDETVDETGDKTRDETVETDSASEDGDAMLDEMMNLLETHGDKWGESDGDERYRVQLPDGSDEQVRTKDDVRALIFQHYR